MAEADRLLITGGRVYDHDGDVHHPGHADVLIEGDEIVCVEPGLADLLAGDGPAPRVIDADDKLLVPGFVNAHYHSHDVLLKGCFETLPLETWVLSALPPSYPRRSREEVRARTLLGAAECLRNGITTIQDMLTLFPFDPDHLDIVMEAYREIGIRTVFALQIGDLKGLDRVPFWRETVPEAFHAHLSAAVEPFGGQDPAELAAEHYLRHRDADPRITWALGPTSPEFCSPALLERLAALSEAHDLPVVSHIYESKSMALSGRMFMPEHGGSQVRYLKATGLLTPRLSLAHSVWMAPDEIELMAEAGANAVLCPAGNLKTKSGIAPARDYIAAGVNLGLGCDNCSCGDAQNMFQAMKLLCGLAAVSDPEPGPPTAADAMRTATLGGARAGGLDGRVGAIRPGMKADISILDLGSLALVPLNSAARQLVFAEGGAAVETVIVAGRVVVADRRLTTIDETALRQAVDDVMPGVHADLDAVTERIAQISPGLLEAWRRSWRADVGLNRYVAGSEE